MVFLSVGLAVVLTDATEGGATGVGWTGDDFAGVVVVCFVAAAVVVAATAFALGFVGPSSSSIDPP